MSTLTVAQISDTHLLENPSDTLRGGNPDSNLLAVLKLIKSEKQKVDLLLLTGDLAEQGSAKAYKRLANYIDQLKLPTYWIPGNHDNSQLMSHYLQSEYLFTDRYCHYKGWRFILLDSTIPGKDGGRLSAKEFDFLEQTLKTSGSLPTVVVLHHHPIKVGGAIDDFWLENADQFWQVIDKYKDIKLVLCGHIHQAFEQTIKQTLFTSCPSTAFQITPKTDETTHDKLLPGYRIVQLGKNGKITTYINRITEL